MHPETVLPQQNLQNLEKLFSALEIENSTAVFTAANADTMGRAINEAIEKRCAKNKNFVFRPNLGLDLYYQFMANCRAMIGNSSSGIIEAASFKTPVINVGSRQKGRTKGINVIDANFEVQSIVKSIHMLKSRSFAGGLRACANPYFFGGASKIIADKLLNVELESQLMLKKFFDYELKGLTG
jgi:UDP-N-acetylglucosamine 2-epimerase